MTFLLAHHRLASLLRAAVGSWWPAAAGLLSTVRRGRQYTTETARLPAFAAGKSQLTGTACWHRLARQKQTWVHPPGFRA